MLSGVRLTRACCRARAGLQIPVELIHYGVTKPRRSRSRVAWLLAGTGVMVNSVPRANQSEGVGTFLKQMAASQNENDVEMERRFFEYARPRF